MKCFIWIVAWLSLFAALTQAQINLYSALLPQHKPQTSNTSTQTTSAPFNGGASNSSLLQLAAIQGSIPLGAISNSDRNEPV
ncbi:hypothetical protein TYRP_019080 [Tyrophagus putrescentiae]|nr:hypothetical protein TYRP_019080 [Tyrophagus putrescentiae]